MAESFVVFPRSSTLPPAQKEVPSEYARDYNEGRMVLSDSPRAAAALARRCMQGLLRFEAKVKPSRSNLNAEIEYAISNGLLPVALRELLHDVREVGNFAAHPEKSKHTGLVLEVEPEEARYCLKVVYDLFEHYFVQAVALERIRASIRAKKQKAN